MDQYKYPVFERKRIGVFSTRQEAEKQTELHSDWYYEIYNNKQEAKEAFARFYEGVPAETTSCGNYQYSMNKISNP